LNDATTLENFLQGFFVFTNGFHRCELRGLGSLIDQVPPAASERAVELKKNGFDSHLPTRAPVGTWL
jgi:hypothetical protein